MDSAEPNMDIEAILQGLTINLSTEDVPCNTDSFIAACQLIMEKLDVLTTSVSSFGPEARKEAIELKAVDLISQGLKWPFPDVTHLDTVPITEPRLWNAIAMLRSSCLRALNALLPGYSQIISPQQVSEILIGSFDDFQHYLLFLPSSSEMKDVYLPEAIKIEALVLMKRVCMGNEITREILCDSRVNSNHPTFITIFCNLVKQSELSNSLIHYWCEALSALLLNDDKRVVPNRSEERKRILAREDILPILSDFITKYTDPAIINTAIIAISQMSNTRDSADELLSAGSMSKLDLILQNFTNEERNRLVINVIGCLRSLSLGSTFQERICKTFIIVNILKALGRMKDKPYFCQTILDTLVYLTIESKKLVHQFSENAGIDLILEIMKKYKENNFILKSSYFIFKNVFDYSDEEYIINYFEDVDFDGKLTELQKDCEPSSQLLLKLLISIYTSKKSQISN